MRTITIHLLKPGKNTTITYHGELLVAEPDHMLIHARWEHPPRDLGYTVFEPGDHFYEHYYTTRWYNIFVIHDTADRPKGWYCNITRPARIDGDTITSEDLELDLFVSADRQTILRLDLDEFAARRFDVSDPEAHAAGLAVLDELEQLARTGAPPFDEKQ
jgi:predicted RNA-binding protein associated with RNAse of E/G family